MKSKITLFDVICSIAPMKLKVIKLIDHLVGGLLAYFMPTAQQRSIKGGPKNILIIRPGGIGDAVFAVLNVPDPLCFQ